MSTAEPAVLRMGRDLVRNFSTLPEEKAAVEIATHIKKFWEPRMKAELLEHLQDGAQDVDPLLAHAAKDLVEDEVDREELAEPSGG